MPSLRRESRIFFFFFTIVLIFVAIPARAADDWLPINEDDLKMTSEPAAPGAPAILLYRQVDRGRSGLA